MKITTLCLILIIVCFSHAEILAQSTCVAQGGVLGVNLISQNGNFGSAPAGSPRGTVGPARPPGTTTYIYQADGYINGSEQYTISNQPTTLWRTDGAWWVPFDHTTGDLTGMMMLINAGTTSRIFYEQTINVTPNTNYEFSNWILNLIRSVGIPDHPNVSFEIDRIGIDDDNNPATPDGIEALTIANSGTIPPNFISPTWVYTGGLINTGVSTQLTIRFRNNTLGSSGNDFALDDLLLSPCTLPSGNITGTLYQDVNQNNTFQSGTDIRFPQGVEVSLLNTLNQIIANTNTDAAGNYSFLSIPIGTGYQIVVNTSDPQTPLGANPTANPSGANTTGRQTGVTVTLGTTLSNQDFGFNYPIPPVPLLVLVKSCTAPATCTTAPQAPGTDVTYNIAFTNSGGAIATNTIIVDPVPVNLDYKLGSATSSLGTTGITFTIEYSTDLSTWAYIPVSSGGGAAAGYDRNVKAIRWRTVNNLPFTLPNNSGSVSFATKIQ